MSSYFRTIGFPDHLFSVESGTFDLDNFQIGSEAILPRFTKVSGMMEQLWSAQLRRALEEREFWQEWKSFRARLAGQAVLFELRVPAQDLPLGAAAGYAPDNPTYPITGVTITGVSLVTGSTTALVEEAAPRYAQALKMNFGSGQAGKLVLTHGDHFGLGGNLYLVVGRVTADAAGSARVPFRWRLWKGANVNDVVTLRNPTCRMQLMTPNEGRVELSAPTFGSSGFSCREVPYFN